jgi:hypothetical protein
VPLAVCTSLWREKNCFYISKFSLEDSKHRGELRIQIMKKTLISAPILSKIKTINHNGTILIRQFFENSSSNSKKMHQQQQQQQQQQPDQGHTFFKTNNSNSNVQQQQEGDTLHKFRKWIKINNQATSDKPGQTFTILNYNILSQKLLEQHSYLYHRHDG